MEVAVASNVDIGKDVVETTSEYDEDFENPDNAEKVAELPQNTADESFKEPLNTDVNPTFTSDIISPAQTEQETVDKSSTEDVNAIANSTIVSQMPQVDTITMEESSDVPYVPEETQPTPQPDENIEDDGIDEDIGDKATLREAADAKTFNDAVSVTSSAMVVDSRPGSSIPANTYFQQPSNVGTTPLVSKLAQSAGTRIRSTEASRGPVESYRSSSIAGSVSMLPPLRTTSSKTTINSFSATTRTDQKMDPKEQQIAMLQKQNRFLHGKLRELNSLMDEKIQQSRMGGFHASSTRSLPAARSALYNGSPKGIDIVSPEEHKNALKRLDIYRRTNERLSKQLEMSSSSQRMMMLEDKVVATQRELSKVIAENKTLKTENHRMAKEFESNSSVHGSATDRLNGMMIELKAYKDKIREYQEKTYQEEKVQRKRHEWIAALETKCRSFQEKVRELEANGHRPSGPSTEHLQEMQALRDELDQVKAFSSRERLRLQTIISKLERHIGDLKQQLDESLKAKDRANSMLLIRAKSQGQSYTTTEPAIVPEETKRKKKTDSEALTVEHIKRTRKPPLPKFPKAAARSPASAPHTPVNKQVVRSADDTVANAIHNAAQLSSSGPIDLSNVTRNKHDESADTQYAISGRREGALKQVLESEKDEELQLEASEIPESEPISSSQQISANETTVQTTSAASSKPEDSNVQSDSVPTRQSSDGMTTGAATPIITDEVVIAASRRESIAGIPAKQPENVVADSASTQVDSAKPSSTTPAQPREVYEDDFDK